MFDLLGQIKLPNWKHLIVNFYLYAEVQMLLASLQVLTEMVLPPANKIASGSAFKPQLYSCHIEHAAYVHLEFTVHVPQKYPPTFAT